MDAGDKIKRRAEMEGRQGDRTVHEIIVRHRDEVGGLLSILHDVQSHYGYLPIDALRRVAKETSWSLVDIHGVATLGTTFTFGPPGRADAGPDGLVSTASARLSVRCRHCNHDLMDTEHRICGQPTVRVVITFADEQGWFRLCSVPQVYTIESEFDLPAAREVAFSCPQCRTDVFPATNCNECGWPMVPIVQPSGRLAPICSNGACRRGIRPKGPRS